MFGFIKTCAHTTANQAELLAILHGLKLAKAMYFLPLEINTDSTNVISMIIKDYLPYNNIILEYNSLMKRWEGAKRGLFGEAVSSRVVIILILIKMPCYCFNYLYISSQSKQTKKIVKAKLQSYLAN